MSSANVNFTQLQSSDRKPGVRFEFNTARANRNLPGNPYNVLIVGQRTTAGAVAANIPTWVFSDIDAAAFFGPGSMAHLMVQAALVANPYINLTVIVLDDAAGSVAATGTTTITGPATGVGVLRQQIGNQYVTVAISSGDSATAIAANLVAAAAQVPSLPVTAANAGGVVTWTAKNKGSQGNSIALATTVTAAGSGAAVVAMANGATDPTIATALATVFAGNYNIVISGWNDQTNLTALRTHLDTISSPYEQRGARGFAATTATLSAATTLAPLINEGRLSLFLLPGTASLPWEVAAAYGAQVASQEDPAVPYDDLPLTGIAPPPVPSQLGRTEQEAALHNGVTPGQVGPGQIVQIVRAISTYTTNPAGVADDTLLDITVFGILDYLRLACRTRVSTDYPRAKATVRTEAGVRSSLLDVLHKLEELEIVQNVDVYAPRLIVELDSQSAGQFNVRIPANIVSGLHKIYGVIDLII